MLYTFIETRHLSRWYIIKKIGYFGKIAQKSHKQFSTIGKSGSFLGIIFRAKFAVYFLQRGKIFLFFFSSSREERYFDIEFFEIAQ